MSRYPLFDRRQIQLRPLAERGCELKPTDVRPLTAPIDALDNPLLTTLAVEIRAARAAGRPVVVLIGGHPVKLGLSRYLIDLMERGLITHLATNGAGIIHDYELALGAGTSESVPRWIRAGQFGLWSETGGLNDIIRRAAVRRQGLGEAVGQAIVERPDVFPHADLSLAAAGWRLGIPVTSHVSIGSDIIHAHANCEGAALGETSMTDFLMFAASIARFAHARRSEIDPAPPAGVFVNIGSAVTGPEVYLKALSMARNVAHQVGEEIRHFTTGVFDLTPLPPSPETGEPAKDDPFYYYRPWKTILVRTVADGGRSLYVQGDHRRTIPTLWRQLGEARACAAA